MTKHKTMKTKKWQTRIREWSYRLGTWWNPPAPPSSTPTGTEKDIQIQEDKQEFKRLLDQLEAKININKDVDIDSLTAFVINLQYYESKLFEKTGYDDGLKGVFDNNIASSAKARASFIKERIIAVLDGHDKGKATDLESKRKKQKALADDLEEEKVFNDEINFLNKKEHRHFSTGMAVFYIFAGIALMFADFPISMNIAKYFIDLPINFDESFYSKIINPEIVFFALGITLLSVYYKIIYDEYVNTSIISDEVRLRPLNRKRNSIITGVRLTIKLAILCGLLWLLWNIGNLRGALNELPVTSSHPNIVKDDEVFNYKLMSFVCTTILLPLVSGVCLSIGLGILSNVNNLKISDRRVKKLSEENSILNKEITDLAMAKDMISSFRRDFNNDLDKHFEHSYARGFHNGHRTKFGDRTFEAARSYYIDHLKNSSSKA